MLITFKHKPYNSNFELSIVNFDEESKPGIFFLFYLFSFVYYFFIIMIIILYITELIRSSIYKLLKLMCCWDIKLNRPSEQGLTYTYDQRQRRIKAKF